MKTATVTAELLTLFLSLITDDTPRPDFRFLFFDTFGTLSAIVPPEMYDTFLRFAERFYDETSAGYAGIMEEINQRLYISRRTGQNMTVRDFLKRKGDKSDFFDGIVGRYVELKTGCGDFCESPEFSTFEKMRKAMIRRRRILRWEYHFTPDTTEMNGKKSVCKALPEEKQKVEQERLKPEKVGKQFSIDISIECTYKQFFDYLDLYPAGAKTFFKSGTRSIGYVNKAKQESTSGTFVWQFQTIKNSRKKIEFLEHFNVWQDTGLTIEEYKKQQEEQED